jgi:pimeloyl-ACP methyl ester carboxylesterase
MNNYTEHSVTSADGTSISYTITGKGPGLLIIHGGFRAAMHYRKLADALSGSFTVYTMDRRGRMKSGPQGSGYSLGKECEDAIAVLKKHSISLVFGHSMGGLVALNTALEFPLTKLALYEPAVSPKKSFFYSWLPRFEKELADSDMISATISVIQGLRMGGPLNYIPKFLLRPLFRMLSKKNPEWSLNAKLLYALPAEIKALRKRNSEPGNYHTLSCPVLILSGSKSPSYFLPNMEALQKIIPGSIHKNLKGIGHNAPDEEAPEKIAPELLDFFLGQPHNQ